MQLQDKQCKHFNVPECPYPSATYYQVPSPFPIPALKYS